MREPMALASVRSLLARPPLFWTRRFAAMSLLCVVATALTSATLLSKYVAERMIRHNAELARDFVGSLMRMHRGDLFFVDRQDTRGIESLFAELARMPGLGHANVFDTARRVVWSTNASAIGQDAGVNGELDGALAGQLEVESELLETTSFIKPEHAFLRNDARDAVEVYIPVQDGGGRVVGVIELYMLPEDLLNDVHEMTRFVWIACVLSGLVTYLALVWLVMMADRQIAQQQRTIVANESLVAVGDMASAVAHGLRNPLGAIRSSAELIAMGPEREMAGDIMSEVDRLQAWIAKLLAYAQQGGRSLAPVQIDDMLHHLVDTHATRMERQGVTVRCDWPAIAAAGAGGRAGAGAGAGQPGVERAGCDAAGRRADPVGAAAGPRSARDRGRHRRRHLARGPAARVHAVPHHQAHRHRRRPAAGAAQRRAPGRQPAAGEPAGGRHAGDPGAAARSPHDPPTAREDRMSYSVLIIEDEPVLARNMLLYLERHGISCQTAASGEEGLAAMEAARPDAVVLDHNLPGQDGLSVLRRMREREPQLPVVMATGHGSEQVAVEAMKAGPSTT
jgi:two-component system, NtrC family, sensor histidine kinase HydH